MTRTEEDMLLSDPCLSYWLKQAIRDSRERDVVDAYHDAKLLSELLLERANTALGALGYSKRMTA